MAVNSNLELRLPDRFVLRRQIGSGGMGVVYEAYDHKRRARVALKTLRHLDAQRLYQFKQEFRALQDLQHENLARLDELLEFDGEWFYVMEYIDGVDMLTYVRPPGHSLPVAPGLESTMESEQFAMGDLVAVNRAERATPVVETRAAADVYDEAKLRSCLRQLAVALDVLHRGGKVHRDIKPGNVLVEAQGRLVLIDFGLVTSRQTSQDSTERGGVAGTAAYMAPEQALSRVTAASDWYSFGLVLYEALVGSRAYHGGTIEVLMDKQQFAPPRPRVLVPDVAEDLEALCLDLIQRDPRLRPSGQRVLERLGVDVGSDPGVTFSTNSSFTQQVPFVGRAEQLEELREAFEQSLRGAPVVRFIHGASGMGKSELVHQFARELVTNHPSTVVLEGRCYERESVPYKAFDGVADRLSRFMDSLTEVESAQLLPLRAGLLPNLFPVLRRVEAIATAPLPRRLDLDPQELRVRMFAAFRELLQKLSDRRPVVVIIDDFQWTDSDSLSLLTELLREPDPPCLLLVATLRARSGLQPALAEVSALGDIPLTHMRLGRLSRQEGETLAARLMPQLASRNPQRVEQIAREADGHPLFIQELAHHAASDPGAHEMSRLNDVLAARVGRLPAPARQVLELISIAGAPVTRETIAYAARVQPDELTGIVGLLRVAHLARAGGARETDMIETYHDRVRYAVSSRLDAEHKAGLHARMAIALARTGADASDPHQLVRHLQAAGKPEQAFRYAVEAARRAEGAMAFDHAVELYRTALRLAPTDDEASPLQIALGSALMNAGRGDEGAEVLLAAAEHADEDMRIACRRRAAEQLFIGGQVERGLGVLQQLLDEIGETLPSGHRRALMSLVWQRVVLRLRGVRWQPRRDRDIPARELTRIDILRTVATSLIMVDTIAGASFEGRALLASLRAGEEHRIGLALAQQAAYLASLGRRARRRCVKLVDKMHNIAARNDDGALLAWARISEGVIAYFAGDLIAADEALTAAEAEFVEHTVGSTFEIGQAQLFQLFTLRHAGELNEMRHRGERFLRDARRRGDRYAENNLRRAIVPLWLAADDVDRAEAELKTLGAIPEQSADYEVQTWYTMETMGELALYQGEADDGLATLAPVLDTMKRTFLIRIEIIATLADWLQARLMVAVAASGRNAPRLLRRALRLGKRLARGQTPYHFVPGQLICAAVRAQTGQRQLALDHLARAMELAIAANMQLHGAGACYYRGKLLGGTEGAELVDRATGWLDEQGVANHERMLQIVAPGIVYRER